MDEDLFRDVDVLSSEDEKEDLDLIKNELFLDQDGKEVNIGSRGERLDHIKKVATLLSRQMTSRSKNTMAISKRNDV